MQSASSIINTLLPRYSLTVNGSEYQYLVWRGEKVVSVYFPELDFTAQGNDINICLEAFHRHVEVFNNHETSALSALSVGQSLTLPPRDGRFAIPNRQGALFFGAPNE